LIVTHCKAFAGYEWAQLLGLTFKLTPFWFVPFLLSAPGWYHSHPRFPPYPSIPDIDAQLEYQIKMKGSSDSTYIPCVGIITSEFNACY
jgi:hypothetical protein